MYFELFKMPHFAYLLHRFKEKFVTDMITCNLFQLEIKIKQK